MKVQTNDVIVSECAHASFLFIWHDHSLVPVCAIFSFYFTALIALDYISLFLKCLPFLVFLLGSSPLLFAACGRAPKEAVRLLLDRGANPNIACNKGYTVLHVIATMTKRGSLYLHIIRFRILYV
jgi:hypothetical protein